MDERINRVAALANVAMYDSEATRRYIDGAPHIKHASLRRLYGGLVVRVFDEARRYADPPAVLDLGAGEGSVTLPFLELGARVTAVDISSSQLDLLRHRCASFGDRLVVRREDINDTLGALADDRFDIVVVNSFLHHVPDYLAVIQGATALLGPHGQFFSFQDPLRYDSIGWPARVFSALAFASWRILQGDVIGGLRRRLRRTRGIYLADSPYDNAEYHAIRGGVDQQAVRQLLEARGFECELIPYFSTQSRLFQPLGAALGIANTFGVIARRRR